MSSGTPGAHSAPTLSAARKKFSEIEDALTVAATHNLNVLMRGERGVGKTMLAHQIVRDMKLRMKYFSTSTLDPFADLIGIPVPFKAKEGLSTEAILRESIEHILGLSQERPSEDAVQATLLYLQSRAEVEQSKNDDDMIRYLRAKDINEAQFMFFDELNRSHKRVRNAVLEIIQFKSLNGERLKHMQMAWAAINPSDSEDYETEPLDEALKDRFHFHIDVPYELNPVYLDDKYGSRHLTEKVFEWWHGLTDDLRSKCSPRRVEIIINAMYQGIDHRWISPLDHPLPLKDLHVAIENLLGKIDLTHIKKNQEHFIEVLRSKEIHNKEFVDTCRILQTLDAKQIAELADVVLAMPEDFVAKLVHRQGKFEDVRRQLYRIYGETPTLFQEYVLKFQSIAAVAPKKEEE